MPTRQDRTPEAGPSTPADRHSTRQAGPSSARPTPVHPAYYSSLGDALGSGRPSSFTGTYSPPPSTSAPVAASVPPPSNSDNRYLYPPQHSPMTSTSSYEYPQYSASQPTSTYDSGLSQLSLPPLRPVQGPSPPHSQAHPPPYSSSAPPPYQPPFSQPSSYPSSSQWTGDWTSQSSYMQASGSSHYTSARADLPTTSTVTPGNQQQQRTSHSPANVVQPEPSSSTRRSFGAERHGFLAGGELSGAPERRERNTPFLSHSSLSDFSSPPAIDFNKLFESYRHLMDVSQALSKDSLIDQGRVPPDNLDRMLQSARSGLKQLNTASASSATRRKSVEGAQTSRHPAPADQPPAKRAKTESGSESQICLGCKVTSTPEWRRGPMGPRTLCNACGLVYAKMMKKRARDANDRQARASGERRPAPSTSAAQVPGLPNTSAGDRSDEDTRYNRDHSRRNG